MKTDEEIREAIEALEMYVGLSQQVGREMDETHSTVRCVADGLRWIFGEHSEICPIDSTIRTMRYVKQNLVPKQQ